MVISFPFCGDVGWGPAWWGACPGGGGYPVASTPPILLGLAAHLLGVPPRVSGVWHAGKDTSRWH